ncbi:hypothetical protein SAMN05443247_06989 [Bradyrhizobium erythrophlei]|nr:hypothetical protein SAMN05443247_06989 [Bradyrhizobium erythrophlei]
MSKHKDPLIFEVEPAVDTTRHGRAAYVFDLTSLRDGFVGRTNIPPFMGDRDFGLEFGLAIKDILTKGRGQHSAIHYRRAAYVFMRFATTEIEGPIEPCHRVLVSFADFLDRYRGHGRDRILSDAPRIYITVKQLFQKMRPGISVPRRRFVAAYEAETVRPIPQGYEAAQAAFKDYGRVRARIATGRGLAERPSPDLLNLEAPVSYTMESVMRLLKTELKYSPISAAAFEDRFGIRPDRHFHFPAPGRAATVGTVPMRSGLSSTFRWVLPTATDLLGPVVLTLENTGWNKSTILNMKHSMVDKAIATAKNGKTSIWSYKGRARDYEKADILCGERSLLEVLTTVQTWTAPLRASIASDLAEVDCRLAGELSAPERTRLPRRKSKLRNMKDRLWLCLSSKTVGTTMLVSDDLTSAKLNAMFEDNDADLDAIGHYNFHEARLHFMARIQNGTDVTVELLRVLSNHSSAATTEMNYAGKLPGTFIRDMPIHSVSEGVLGVSRSGIAS